MANSSDVAAYAASFPKGHWSFFGPGAEEKWYGTHICSQNGVWNHVVEMMMISLTESGQFVFRGTSALTRGLLTSKGGGKTLRHYKVIQQQQSCCFTSLFQLIIARSTKQSRIGVNGEFAQHISGLYLTSTWIFVAELNDESESRVGRPVASTQQKIRNSSRKHSNEQSWQRRWLHEKDFSSSIFSDSSWHWIDRNRIHSSYCSQCCWCFWLCRDCILDVTCVLILTCCTSLVVSSHERDERNGQSSHRLFHHGSGAGSVCEWNVVPDVAGLRWRKKPQERCNSSSRRLWTFLPGNPLICKLHRPRADSKQQTCLQHSGRKYELHLGTQTTGVGVVTRLQGSPGGFSGSLKCVAILECSVQGYAGAAVPRLQKLMTEAAKASMPISNAWRKTIGQRQFYWMMLIFCKEQHLTSCFWRVIVKVSRHGDNWLNSTSWGR